jgi:hypothetical protein
MGATKQKLYQIASEAITEVGDFIKTTVELIPVFERYGARSHYGSEKVVVGRGFLCSIMNCRPPF